MRPKKWDQKSKKWAKKEKMGHRKWTKKRIKQAPMLYYHTWSISYPQKSDQKRKEKRTKKRKSLCCLRFISYCFFFHFLTDTNIYSDKHFPGLQYIEVTSIHKTCFWFYFQTQNMVNKRFPVHFQDHHVTHKIWFYQNFPLQNLKKIFRGSNILDPLPPCSWLSILSSLSLSYKHQHLQLQYTIFPLSY